LAGKEDGSRSLPVKIDSTYHVEGRLVFADHHCIKHLVNTLVPLLRAGGDHEKIILSPLLRYLKPCCRDKSHITNRKEPSYFSDLGRAVSDMRESIKGVIYGKKIRSFKVLEPVSLLGDGEDELATATKLMPYFSADPVHLSPDGYSEILQGILNQIMEGSFTRTPKTAATTATAGQTKDWSRYRKQWVNKDDTVAHRTYQQHGRGHSHGGFKWGASTGPAHFTRGRGGYCGGYGGREGRRGAA
jgi:hypothetical protein